MSAATLAQHSDAGPGPPPAAWTVHGTILSPQSDLLDVSQILKDLAAMVSEQGEAIGGCHAAAQLPAPCPAALSPGVGSAAPGGARPGRVLGSAVSSPRTLGAGLIRKGPPILLPEGSWPSCPWGSPPQGCMREDRSRVLGEGEGRHLRSWFCCWGSCGLWPLLRKWCVWGQRCGRGCVLLFPVPSCEGLRPPVG